MVYHGYNQKLVSFGGFDLSRQEQSKLVKVVMIFLGNNH